MATISKLERRMATSRQKRSSQLANPYRYRCNMEMVYGIKFYGVYNPKGIMARRCCCPDYKGEYFEV